MLTKLRSLKARLWLLGIISVFGMALLSGVSLFYAYMSKARLVTFVDQHVALNRQALAAYANGLQTGQALRNIVLDPANGKAYDNYTAGAEKLDKAMKSLLDQLRKDNATAPVATALQERMSAWQPLQMEVLNLVKAGDLEQAKSRLTSKETPAWRSVRELLLEQVTQSEKRTDAVRDELIAGLNTSNNLVLVVSLLGLVIVTAGIVLVGRGVFHQVGGEPGDAAAALISIAHGDLGKEIPAPKGSQDSVLAALKATQSQLRDLIDKTISSASQVVEASELLNREAANVSQATLTQNEAAASIAAAIEELTVGIGTMSDNANAVSGISSDVAAKSRAGVTAVTHASEAMQQVADGMTASTASMEELSQRVASINQIVQTIREIADQTNLLALNAAIEAARAGEQGRGFAVVADEVRKLAERTTASTEEISTMISSVQQGAEATLDKMSQAASLAATGKDRTAEVRTEVEGLDSAVTEVRASVDAIARALQEQSAASTDIAQRVERIVQGIEQISGSARNSSRHSGALVGYADQLKKAVGHFRL